MLRASGRHAVVVAAITVGCRPPPAPSPGPVAPSASVVASASSVAPASAPDAPLGECWVDVADAAKVGLDHALQRHGAYLAATVDVDARHGAHLHAPRTGTVASLAASPGIRVAAGATLLTIDTGRVGGVATLRSPIDGEVISVGVGIGDAVTGADTARADHPATELAFVADLEEVVIVTSAAPPLPRVGAPASFVAPSIPSREYQCQIAAVASDRSHLSCSTPNLDRRLTIGLRGTLFVEGDDVPGLWLPRSALVAGGPTVWVRKGEAPGGRARFVATAVTTSFDGGGDRVAVAGLSTDDAVARDPNAVPCATGRTPR